MNVLRSAWSVVKWLASSIGEFLLWSVWLVLASLLVLQIVIACSHELRIPRRLVRSFEDRLALSGLHASFESASFDPAGNVLVENLRLFSDSFDDPLVTCSSVLVKIDPLGLLVGHLEAESVQGHGVTLYVPAMFSPTGRTEAVVDRLELLVRPRVRQLDIEQFVGRAGPLAVSCRGAVRLAQRRPGTPLGRRAAMAEIVNDYTRVAQKAVLWQAKLAKFEHPSLEVILTPDEFRLARATVSFCASDVEMNAETFGSTRFKQGVRGHGLRVNTALPLVVAPQSNAQAGLSLASIEVDDGSRAEHISAALTGMVHAQPLNFDSWEFSTAIGEIKSHGVSVSNVSLQAQPSTGPRVSAGASFRLADQAWRVDAGGDPKTGEVQVETDGKVSPAILELIGQRIGRDLNDLVATEAPATLHAQVEFGPGWKPAGVRGNLAVGKVVARNVALDRARADFQYRGTDVQVTDILLAQGENSARGSYTMDTKSLDYRFLLTGRLRPVGINGWFHEWWPRFWSHFDFAGGPPDADVDVEGRWREPHLTTVYIFVDAKSPIVREVPFDRLRTTLFIRPDFYDGLEFFATRGTGSARGRFTRSVDLDKRGFRWMDFDVDGDLELQETARLFGEQGTEIVDPYRFEHPPHLKIKGRLEGEASPGGEHEMVLIDVASKGAFQFFGFPLSDLTCRAKVQDHNIDVTGLKVVFAEGNAQGTAKVSGRGDNRTLSFDGDVQSASLGEAIRVLETFSAKRRGEKPPASSRFQQRVASGKLDLHATAKGLYQDPYSFAGSGTAELRGAELAEVNLLGSLSEAFKGNSLLGFTSWRLDTAKTTFTIEHEKLVFPDLRITGPTARLEAHGAYRFDKKTMAFNAKFFPFEEGKTLLANAVGFVLAPVSAALELKLSGSVDQPRWYFAYGPTNFFRKIAGNEETPPPGGGTPAPDEPPVLLRRR